MIDLGTPKRDTLIGSQESDFLSGGAGDDVIRGFAAPVSPTVDPTRISLTDAADVLFGGKGNDSILAGGGNDFVSGGSGRDTIGGGTGADFLLGGADSDIFEFTILFASPGSPSVDSGVGQGNRDIIIDFKQGADKIDLTGWEDLNFDAPGGQFIGEQPLTLQQQLQVAFHFENGNTVIDLGRAFFAVASPSFGRTVGEPTNPAGQIELVGHVNLVASDFIFSV